jgi:hypothetical protein
VSPRATDIVVGRAGAMPPVENPACGETADVVRRARRSMPR